jgi:hypothetical protein
MKSRQLFIFIPKWAINSASCTLERGLAKPCLGHDKPVKTWLQVFWFPSLFCALPSSCLNLLAYSFEFRAQLAFLHHLSPTAVVPTLNAILDPLLSCFFAILLQVNQIFHLLTFSLWRNTSKQNLSLGSFITGLAILIVPEV